MKTCLSCGEEILGRIDKKFCDDQCRASYNNKTRRPDEENIRRIYSILRKNRSILKSLNPVGKSTVRKEVLDALGFDVQFITSTYTSSTGKTYRFCFEYGYLPLSEGNKEKFLLVNWQNYMLKQP